MEILVGILVGIILVMFAAAVLYVSNENIWAEAFGFAILSLGAISMVSPVLFKTELPPAETPIHVSVDTAVKDKITTSTQNIINVQIVLPSDLIQSHDTRKESKK